MSSWAIAAPHAASTRIGATTLEHGGSAADAAIATAASLCVTLPNNVALGGDLFALVAEPDGEIYALNASGPAALATDPAALRAQHGESMPSRGAATVTVPGLPAGLAALGERYGRLPRAELLSPAIAQASDGVELDRQVAMALDRGGAELAADPGIESAFFSGARPARRGERIVQARLAAALEALAADGAAAFYAGELGARWLQTMTSAGSVLSRADLRGFRPEWSAPVTLANAGQELAMAPPNSQALLVGSILAELERGATPPADPLEPEGALPYLRACLRAARVRDTAIADPRFARVDVEAILAGVEPGAGAEPPPSPPSGDTVGIAVVDADGLAVSLVASLFGSFGSGILCPQTGILAHNRGSFFSLRPGHPNEIAPGKRPAHTLSPVLISERGKLRHVIATRGGRAQPQILAGVIQRLRSGDGAAEALAAPRIIAGAPGSGQDPDTVGAEPGVPSATLAAIAAAGHPIDSLPAMRPEAGETQIVSVGRNGPSAASDPRSDGLALSG